MDKRYLLGLILKKPSTSRTHSLYLTCLKFYINLILNIKTSYQNDTTEMLLNGFLKSLLLTLSLFAVRFLSYVGGWCYWEGDILSLNTVRFCASSSRTYTKMNSHICNLDTQHLSKVDHKQSSGREIKLPLISLPKYLDQYCLKYCILNSIL